MTKYRVKIDDSELEQLFSLDELLSNGLLDDYDENIKIKQSHEREWVVARNYPFHETESANAYNINEDGSITRNHSMEQNSNKYSVNDDGTITRQQNYHRPRKPDTNMVWAIISLSICLPFGILALMESVKVDSRYSDGDVDGAILASEKSKQWCLWTIYSWIAIIVIVVIAAAIG